MIITKQSDLEALCATLSEEPYITIDTEFLREKTYYPKLCLVQVSDAKKNAAAIDPLAEDLDLSPLFSLLQNKNVLKIFHAARQDLEIFFNLTGKVVEPFFDTQIAAMVCGYGDQIGYENLVRDITSHQIDKSSQFTDWSRRPLSDKQLRYALADVTHLVNVYQSLSKRLDKQNRTEWVFEEEGILSSPETYSIDPRTMWQKVKIRTPKPKTLAILRELAAWREERAQKKNIPRSWIMKDDTLSDMAHQAPRNKQALKKIRGLSADLVDSKIGDVLLDMIAAGEKVPPADYPPVKKRKPMAPAVAATIEILRMLLKIQAAEHDVAAKLIASADDIEALARGHDTDLKLLQGWRYDIFGKTAEALQSGTLSIGLRDGKIVKFNLDEHKG